MTKILCTGRFRKIRNSPQVLVSSLFLRSNMRILLYLFQPLRQVHLRRLRMFALSRPERWLVFRKNLNEKECLPLNKSHNIVCFRWFFWSDVQIVRYDCNQTSELLSFQQTNYFSIGFSELLFWFFLKLENDSFLTFEISNIRIRVSYTWLLKAEQYSQNRLFEHGNRTA